MRWLIGFLSLQLYDTLVTHHALANELAQELNPLAHQLWTTGGVFALLGPKLLGSALIAHMVHALRRWPRLQRAATIGTLALMGAVAINNTVFIL